MNKKPNTILKSILIPFLLIFMTIFLTHVGMQTQLMDQEMGRFISQSLGRKMNIIRDYFVTEEVKIPRQRLEWMMDSLDNVDKAEKGIFPSCLGVMKHDLYLDHIALFDLNGGVINQQVLSAKYEKKDLTDFQNLIADRKADTFGIDQTRCGLLVKMIFPIRRPGDGIVAYMSAIRCLDNSFFEKVHQSAGLDILVFKDDRAIFSTVQDGEEFVIPPQIREKVFDSEGAEERIFISDIEYQAISFPFKNLRGEVVGALMLVCNLEAKKHSLEKIVLNLLWATLLGVTLLLFFGFFISRGITTPINQLIQATRRVSSGDFEVRAEIKSHQELIALSQAFNSMAENLSRTSMSKDYFYAIIHTINDLLIIVSPDRKIEFVNQAAVSVLGYSRAELSGKAFDCLFHKDCPIRGMDLDTIVHNGKGYSCMMLTKAGQTIPVSFSWAAMWDEKKQLTEIVGVARDIREKAEAEQKIREERDKLNTLINTTNDLIFIRDFKGKVTFVSHAVRHILGYSAEEFKDLTPEKMLSSNPLNQNFIESPARWSAGGGQGEPYWVEFLTSDGRPLFLEINEALLQGDGQIMGIGRDISERRRLEEQLLDWREKQAKAGHEKYHFGGLIGKSKKMQEIYDLINIVAQNNSTVLLKGESGTGKELISQAIHYHSPRQNYPLVEVTCSTLSEHLLESELFGHVKGAFTGAIKDKQGRFEQANRGTIFLDEVGDISLDEQVKLLRVLQEREIVRVGGDERIKVDVRIIAATNKNLEEAVTKGEFREDLYYRLNVVPIEVPALRERKEDIPLLVEHFIEKLNQRIGKNINDISQKAMNLLLEYSWPGNIRQLENAIEYAMIRCTAAQIKLRDLPSGIKNQKAQKASVQDLIASTEKSAILEALKSSHWDLTQVAQQLNISRTTLWRKLKKYGIKKLKS